MCGKIIRNKENGDVVMEIRNIQIIDENNYSSQMIDVVKPYLQEFEKTGSFSSFDGNNIFYRFYLNDSAKANVVVVHGFTENSEKFLEMIYYYHKNGYNVFSYDQRGHGNSYREVEDTSISHINKFDEYVCDLESFVDNIVKKTSPDRPNYLFAHSMGGAVGILYMMKNPDSFAKAVLTAPMVFPQTAGVPAFASKLMAKFFCLIGKGKDRVFIHSEFDPKSDFENSNDTSEARYEYAMDLKRNNKQYQNCSASYSWVYESLKITKDIFNKKKCEKINTPVLLLQAEVDGSVRKELQPEFIKLLKYGSIKEIKGSKHEIYLSSNDVMKEYLEEIFSFFED